MAACTCAGSPVVAARRMLPTCHKMARAQQAEASLTHPWSCAGAEATGQAAAEAVSRAEDRVRGTYELDVAQAPVSVATRNTPPLVLVRRQQPLPSPALAHTRQLPAQVEDILQACVHAEASGRWQLVRRLQVAPIHQYLALVLVGGSKRKPAVYVKLGLTDRN